MCVQIADTPPCRPAHTLSQATTLEGTPISVDPQPPLQPEVTLLPLRPAEPAAANEPRLSWLSVLLTRFGHGGQLAGLSVSPARVLVVSEESTADWEAANRSYFTSLLLFVFGLLFEFTSIRGAIVFSGQDSLEFLFHAELFMSANECRRLAVGVALLRVRL